MSEIINFPEGLPVSRCLFVPQFNTKMTRSAFSNHEHIVENPGEYWVIQYFFRVLTNQQAKALRAHLSQLRGSVNKSRVYDTKFKEQSGTWAGTPRVKGANQYGLILQADGFNPNQLVAGALDRCLVGDQLMEVRSDCYSDQNGNVTLLFSNELRNMPSDNEVIITDPSALKATARWSKPEQIRQLTGNKRTYQNITIDFEEAFL